MNRRHHIAYRLIMRHKCVNYLVLFAVFSIMLTAFVGCKNRQNSSHETQLSAKDKSRAYRHFIPPSNYGRSGYIPLLISEFERKRLMNALSDTHEPNLSITYNPLFILRINLLYPGSPQVFRFEWNGSSGKLYAKYIDGKSVWYLPYSNYSTYTPFFPPNAKRSKLTDSLEKIKDWNSQMDYYRKIGADFSMPPKLAYDGIKNMGMKEWLFVKKILDETHLTNALPEFEKITRHPSFSYILEIRQGFYYWVVNRRSGSRIEELAYFFTK